MRSRTPGPSTRTRRRPRRSRPDWHYGRPWPVGKLDDHGREQQPGADRQPANHGDSGDAQRRRGELRSPGGGNAYCSFRRRSDRRRRYARDRHRRADQRHRHLDPGQHGSRATSRPVSLPRRWPPRSTPRRSATARSPRLPRAKVSSFRHQPGCRPARARESTAGHHCTANGTQATATAIVGANNTITGITITNPGSGYSSSPATIDRFPWRQQHDPATATATFSTGGAGYLSPPWSPAERRHRRTATATVVSTGVVTSIDISGGSGCLRAPITIAPPLDTATATAIGSDGTVSGITVNYGGNGYSSTTPPLGRPLGGGNFPSGDRMVTNSVVTAINFTGRSGYTTAHVGHDHRPDRVGALVGQLRQPRHRGHAHLHPGARRLRHGDDHRLRDQQRRGQ